MNETSVFKMEGKLSPFCTTGLDVMVIEDYLIEK